MSGLEAVARLQAMSRAADTAEPATPGINSISELKNFLNGGANHDHNDNYGDDYEDDFFEEEVVGVVANTISTHSNEVTITIKVETNGNVVIAN